MTQVPGSNAAGEVFANFKVDTTPAEQGIDRIGQKAVDTGNKIEKDVGQKGGDSLKQMSTGALGAAAAVGAAVAAVDRALKAVGEWNASAANLARVYDEINQAAGDIATSAGQAGANFDQLAKQATEFGQAQIEALSKATESWDIATLARKAYASAAGVDLEEEGQINQILGQRTQLLETINKLREEAFTEAADAALRKRQGEDQLREANALAALEKELQASRRAALTEQERKIEELEEKLRSIEERRRESSNPQARAEYERYAQFFAAQLRKEMAPIAEDFAAKIMDKVRSEFTAFESGSATAFFGRIEGSIDTIAAQLQSRGMV